MSMEDDDVWSHNLADLTDEQWEELFDWVDKFQDKYTLVGRLAGWDPGVSLSEINRRSGFSLKSPPEESPQVPGSLNTGTGLEL
mmetsp:Transcript_5143/g.5663  ORF Transcript_5143/g.5663 Transcript_5143/m.5663 type:complete len:84 (-) Transcript_5143:82-333(-)